MRPNLSNLFSLFKKSGSSGFEDAGFRRVIGDEARDILPAGRRAPTVTLAPMRSLSLDAFTFPFSNAAKVREALRLQVMPYAAAGEMEIFPVVLEKKGRGAEGVAWYASPEELKVPDEGAVVWPAPLPLAGRVEGTGVTLWADEENLCSLLWQEGRPILSRWRPRSRTTPEAELAWFDLYCKDRELGRGASFVFDVTEEGSADSLRDIVRESLALCPWLGAVNLSRTALEGAMDLERTVGLMTRAACWLLLIGVLALGGSWLRWNQLQNKANEVRARSEALYREVFEPNRTGRIANPVALARDRIAALQGGGDQGHGLDEVLSDMGEIFTADPSMDVTVDILRYNSDGVDCTGSAPDMSTVLAFRKAWADRAALSQPDNIQSVSGVGYRFDLRVRW